MARSTFNSTIPGSGWFTAVHPELGPVIVSATGFGFVKSLQKIAKDALSSPMATYDGTQISGSQIAVDGNWGSKTYKALWALANRMGATSLAAAIRSDALASRAPSRTTMMVAAVVVAEAFRAAAGTVFVPTDVIPPPYGRVAPGAGTTITLERFPAGAASGNVRPVPISGSLPTGVDIVALPPDPTVTVTIPPRLPTVPDTGITPGTPSAVTGTPESQLRPTQTLGSGVSWGFVAAAVVGVGAAVWLAKSLSSKPVGHARVSRVR